MRHENSERSVEILGSALVAPVPKCPFRRRAGAVQKGVRRQFLQAHISLLQSTYTYVTQVSSTGKPKSQRGAYLPLSCRFTVRAPQTKAGRGAKHPPPGQEAVFLSGAITYIPRFPLSMAGAMMEEGRQRHESRAPPFS